MAQLYSVRDVKRALRKYRRRLMAFPGVIRLAIGEKRSRGRGTGCIAIRAVVARKVRSLPRSKRLPKRVRGVTPDGQSANYWIPIDVEAGPRQFRALTLRGGDRIGRAERGMIGLLYVSASGRNYLLTNAHVVARPNETAFNRPVVLVPSNEKIGEIERYSRLTVGAVHRMDAALVWLYEGVSADYLQFVDDDAQLVRTERFKLVGGEYFLIDRNGNPKRFRNANALDGQHIVTVGATDLLFEQFWTLTAVGPIAVPGDSGSLLMRRTAEGLVAAGLLFAGNGKTAAAYPIDTVLSTLATSEASQHNAPEDVRIRF